MIGGGHFGTVRAAHLINDPSKKFAVKTINKDSIDIDVQLLINEIRTLQLGANAVLVTASVDFDDTTRAIHIKAATNRLEKAIKAEFPVVTNFYIEVEAADDHAAMGEGNT